MQQQAEPLAGGLVPPLAAAVAQALISDAVSPACAALGAALFPQAAGLSLCLLTADPSGVLACVGNLLAAGPLSLGLLPVQASAAGAAVAARAPVYLNRAARQALPECFDFPLPGTATAALLCLPICAQQGGRCLGALTLAFTQGGQPDGPHTRALLQLAAALAAPGLLAAAAAPLLQQCGLILGVQAPAPAVAPTEAAAGGEQAEEEKDEGAAGSGSELFLSDSEAEEAEALLPGSVAAAAAAAAEEAAEAASAAPQWAAGACRGPGSEPPDDPGSGAAALVVPGSSAGPPPDAAAALAAAAARGRGSQGRAQQPEPESPSAIKARAKALARQPSPSTSVEAGRSASGATAQGAPAGGSAPLPPLALKRAAEGEAGSSASLAGPPSKNSPTASEASSASAEGGGDSRGAALAAQAGAGWRSLLRFADPALERRFAAYHAAQLWRVDVLSFSLCLAYLAALRAAAPGAAPLTWVALQAAAAAGPLAALLSPRRRAYLRHREPALALLFLACGWCPHPPAFSEALAARLPWQAGGLLPAPRALLAALQMCCLVARMQARMAVQAPLQLLMFAASAGCGARSWPELAQAAALAVAAPLAALYHIEARSRGAFLLRLPLLPIEAP